MNNSKTNYLLSAEDAPFNQVQLPCIARGCVNVEATNAMTADDDAQIRIGPEIQLLNLKQRIDQLEEKMKTLFAATDMQVPGVGDLNRDVTDISSIVSEGVHFAVFR